MAGYRFTASKQLKHLLTRFVKADSKIVQYAGCNAFSFTDKTKQDMFSSHIGMTKLTSFVHG
ncbi:hypothetical protein D3C81_1224930 [compost metagenome]